MVGADLRAGVLLASSTPTPPHPIPTPPVPRPTTPPHPTHTPGRKKEALQEKEAGNEAYKKKDFEQALAHYNR